MCPLEIASFVVRFHAGICRVNCTSTPFFFWEFLKDQVYTKPVRDIVDIRNKITNAVGNVTQIMLPNTWRNFEQPLEFVAQNGESHCEIHSCFCAFVLSKVFFSFDGRPIVL